MLMCQRLFQPGVARARARVRRSPLQLGYAVARVREGSPAVPRGNGHTEALDSPLGPGTVEFVWFSSIERAEREPSLRVPFFVPFDRGRSSGAYGHVYRRGHRGSSSPGCVCPHSRVPSSRAERARLPWNPLRTSVDGATAGHRHVVRGLMGTDSPPPHLWRLDGPTRCEPVRKLPAAIPKDTRGCRMGRVVRSTPCHRLGAPQQTRRVYQHRNRDRWR